MSSTLAEIRPWTAGFDSFGAVRTIDFGIPAVDSRVTLRIRITETLTRSQGEAVRYLTDDAADGACGVVDQRNDSGVVKPRRADDADGAQDALLRIAERRHHHRAAGIGEQRIVGADEDLHARRGVGELDQAGKALATLQRIEQLTAPPGPG